MAFPLTKFESVESGALEMKSQKQSLTRAAFAALPGKLYAFRIAAEDPGVFATEAGQRRADIPLVAGAELGRNRSTVEGQCIDKESLPCTIRCHLPPKKM